MIKETGSIFCRSMNATRVEILQEEITQKSDSDGTKRKRSWKAQKKIKCKRCERSYNNDEDDDG